MENNYIELTKENFVVEMVRYGYFYEEIPPYFNTKKLVGCIPEIIKLTNSYNIKGTAPTTLSIYKNDIARRVFSLPNPYSFLKLVQLMSDNWDNIKKHAQSDNSHSPITFIHNKNEQYGNFFDDSEEKLNHEKVRESLKIKSAFIHSIKENITLSLGYKYLLNIDIANFYNTIYTHSITWAICGKKNAKKIHHNIEQPTNDYKLAEKLDKLVREQKNNETNGILIGPYTSNIISEIIMARVDKDLLDKKYIFKRYVDDFKLYFRTEIDAMASIPAIEKIVNEYGLILNTSKTQITKYPFLPISKMKDTLTKTLKDEGVFAVLNAASIFYNNNEKSAYKYAIKMIREIPYDTKKDENFSTILSMLINIMLINPRLGRYIIEYLKLNEKFIIKDDLSNSINQELKTILDNKLEEEILLFVYISRELNLTISAENVIKILKYGDDFSIIITLDIYKKYKNNYDDSSEKKIKEKIEWLITNLNNETLTGSRWLLLHEIFMHGLISNTSLSLKSNPFFTKLRKKQISFYESITSTYLPLLSTIVD